MLSPSPDQQMNPGLRLAWIQLVQHYLFKYDLQRIRSPFIFHIPQMFFPLLLLPVFNPLVGLCTTPTLNVSYFLL